MKFMKLGSRPDTFYTTEAAAAAIRSVSSEIASDLILKVKGTTYLLHKFPLLSKCLRLQKLCAEIVELEDFPGGIEAFEVCAKFCYGITITLSAYNLVAIRCAAEYLQMTQDVEKGNLVHKIEVFFTCCILHGWRDTIVTLQTTKAFPLLSQDLGITTRCVEAIVSKVVAHPSKVSLSLTQSTRGKDVISLSSKGWWGEDLADLEIDVYWRTMIGIKCGGRVPSILIGDALRIYASKWLPNISTSDSDQLSKNRMLLESILTLLPTEKGEVSCTFLLKLLKAVNILKASSSSKTELAARIGVQLEEASVGDLLIPSQDDERSYDVDVVITMLEHFNLQGRLTPPTSPPRNRERRRRSRSAENVHGLMMFQEGRRSSSASHSTKLKVAKLVDVYLQKIAKDKNLALSKFIAVAEAIPEFARPDHDDLYKAIDIYLKGHPELNKSERKRLCRILECKKLSAETCMHAAQNEMLPLRVVVQVLFFEQARAGAQVADLPSNIKALLAVRKNPSLVSVATTNAAEDEWSISGLKSPKSNNVSTLKMKLDEDDDDFDDNFPGEIGKSCKLRSFCVTPNRPKRMFSKLWPSNKSTTTSDQK